MGIKVAAYKGYEIFYDSSASEFSFIINDETIEGKTEQEIRNLIDRHLKQLRKTIQPVQVIVKGGTWEYYLAEFHGFAVTGGPILSCKGEKTRAHSKYTHIYKYDAKVFLRLLDLIKQNEKIDDEYSEEERKLEELKPKEEEP